MRIKEDTMAQEILSIPEENLVEVIKVIYTGLKHVGLISETTKQQLERWCQEEANYLGVTFVDFDILDAVGEVVDEGIDILDNKQLNSDKDHAV